MDIQNRIALVTGAGAGTGRAIGERLAAGGAAVALTDVSRADETSGSIHSAGGQAEFVAADLTSPGGVRDAVDFAVDTFGGLDILVNNAGGIPYDTPGSPGPARPTGRGCSTSTCVRRCSPSSSPCPRSRTVAGSW